MPRKISRRLLSTGMHPLNPRTVLGKLKPERAADHKISLSWVTTPKPYIPPPITPTAPRAISHLKHHALQMVTQNTPSSSKLKVLIDQLGRAAEGAAADRDLSAEMLKDLHSKAKDLSSAAAKGRRQLSKARVIDAEEVVRLQDERERKDNNVR